LAQTSEDHMATNWFKRDKEGIRTPKSEQVTAPDGLWVKCTNCKRPTHFKELQERLHVCPFCDHHQRIGSTEYFDLLFDNSQYEELFANFTSKDPLSFTDTKAYPKRLAATQEKTRLKDAARTAHGTLEEQPAIITCMDFAFIGGSMGSVVGEKIARGIDEARERGCAAIVISKSGGARMMEGTFSLLQMAKTSAKLAQLADAGLPFISVMTDPTTGGVTASFAMLGDLNIAEPNALIGFAGPRVIRETIGRDLPEGFQRAEFLLEHGFLDRIVHRHDLKRELAQAIRWMVSP